MKIILLCLTALVAIAGWLKPRETPRSLNISVVAAIVVALGLQIYLDQQDAKENKTLQQQVAELHTSGTARAKFELMVNGASIEQDKQVIDISQQSGLFPLELRIRNVGDVSGHDVQAFLWIPEEIEIQSLGNKWSFNGTPKKPSDPIQEVAGVREYAFIAPAAINVHNWMITRPGQLNIVDQGQVVPMRLKLYAEGGVFQEWKFAVRPKK